MSRLDLPSDQPLRVIPDVHGEADPFSRLVREAVAERRFVLQLGDIVDRGPDSGRALALMLDLMDAGLGAMIMGNHDWKIARHLSGREVVLKDEQHKALAEIAAIPGLAERFVRAVPSIALYARWNDMGFAHGGWDTAMDKPGRPGGDALRRVRARALYGQTTGRKDAKGRPERDYAWVDALPGSLDVVIGHDWRGCGVVLRRRGAQGGSAYLLDLGAGKGGALAHLDLDPGAPLRFSHPVADWSGCTFDLCPQAD